MNKFTSHKHLFHRVILMLILLMSTGSFSYGQFRSLSIDTLAGKSKIKYTYSAFIHGEDTRYLLEWTFSKTIHKAGNTSFMIPNISSQIHFLSEQNQQRTKHLNFMRAELLAISQQYQWMMLNAPSKEAIERLHFQGYMMAMERLKWAANLSEKDLDKIIQERTKVSSDFELEYLNDYMRKSYEEMREGFGLQGGIGLGYLGFLSSNASVSRPKFSLNISAKILTDEWEFGGNFVLTSLKANDPIDSIFEWEAESSLLNIHSFLSASRWIYRNDYWTFGAIAGFDIGSLLKSSKNAEDKDIIQGLFSISPAIGGYADYNIFNRKYLIPDAKGKYMSKRLFLRGKLYLSKENYPGVPASLYLFAGVSFHYEQREIFRR